MSPRFGRGYLTQRAPHGVRDRLLWLLGSTLVLTMLVSACAAGGTHRRAGAASCSPSCAAATPNGTPSGKRSTTQASASSPSLSGRITATRCPNVADISQLVGKPMQQAVGTEQGESNGTAETLLACLYNPAGTPIATSSSYSIKFTMHGPPDSGIFTSLADSLASDESGGLQAGSTINTPGATIHLFMTPDLGPGTYATYLGSTTGQLSGTCTVKVLGPNGYVMDITADAQRAADYDGDLSESTQCGWAEGAARLAMTS